MSKNVVIVESPAKAKTLAKFLGSQYKIKSSFGHIRDLPKKDFGVDIAKDFKPTYQISPDKQKVVKELAQATKDATVWLASDEDREGEAIAWHLSEALKLKPEKTHRIVFHEITKPAVINAVANPRKIDMNLVHAQQARRVLDRLVGYELSPVLWKKIKAGLSAGRVQSVAVRLIVDREREIKAFKPESSFKLTAIFKADSEQLPAELNTKLKDLLSSKNFLAKLSKASFKVTDIAQKDGVRNPPPPFTTSTLQQEAARRLGFSVKQTMTLAQRLYEDGYITYMRTDSVNLSDVALKASGDYIVKNFGGQYYHQRRYKTTSRSAQEAHEAIRPTNVGLKSAGSDAGQKKLYEFIWRRMLASQMAAAKVQRTEIEISISNQPEKFLAKGEVLVFDGFYKVYSGGKEDVILPKVKLGQQLKLEEAMAGQSYSRPAARYTEGSLVKKLEELGIGRPSTYAPTISTIQTRGYIEKKDVEGQKASIDVLRLKTGKLEQTSEEIIIGVDKNKLIPTTLAEIVTDFLVKYFAEVVDYDFTAQAENQLDDIADGKLTWQKMLKQFYEQFHPLVGRSEKASRAEASQARKLGKDPKSGLEIIARYGRYGPMLQKGEVPKGSKDKPDFAPLPPDTSLESVTLEQALPMFQLPREVGSTKSGETIIANIGRFGPYVKAGKIAASIKGHSPFTIGEKLARELIEARISKEKNRVINDFGRIQVLNGPYGPYVTDGKNNARIPKDSDPKELNQEAAKKLLENKKQRRGAPKTS